MEQLTRAEEQVMQALWQIEKGFVKDVMEAMPKPVRAAKAPAYTTVSTIIRILEQKGFVGHEAFGRAHRYHPIISRDQYGERTIKQFTKNYFGGSAHELLSHFIEREDLSAEDLDELLILIKKHREK
ncbi:MAG: BlaI/MecI/CopY family transcriptional regulator [Flavobacteriales bacterium]|nr:BlaI/MecI/CopY family transcriptional regulator [Flavobacteriales bacterium]